MSVRRYGSALKRARSNTFEESKVKSAPVSPISSEFDSMVRSLSGPTRLSVGVPRQSSKEIEHDPFADIDGADSEEDRRKSLPGTNQRRDEEFSIEQFVGRNREQLEQIKYQLDGLKSSQALSVRHTSALTLARLVESSSVCFLIRANGGFKMIFQAFEDCTGDQILSYAAVTIAYLASQDPVNRDHLPLNCATRLLKFLTQTTAVATTAASSTAGRNIMRKSSKRKRASSSTETSITDFAALVKTVGSSGKTVSVPELVWETLSLASSSPDFAQMLIDQQAVQACVTALSEDVKLICSPTSEPGPKRAAQLRLRRVVRVLEHLTSVDPVCRDSLLSMNIAGWPTVKVVETKAKSGTSPNGDEAIGNILLLLLDLLDNYYSSLEGHSADEKESIMCLLRLTVNLTNHQQNAVRQLREIPSAHHRQESGLHLVLRYTRLASSRSAQLFDILTSCLGILINCSEKDKQSRFQLAGKAQGRDSSQPQLDGVEIICKLFSQNYSSSRVSSASSSASSSSSSSSSSFDSLDSSSVIEPPSNVGQSQSQGLETELLASYSALLLGCLALEPELKPSIESQLPHNGFSLIVDTLKEFLVLQSDANLLTEEALESVVNIVEALDKTELGLEG